MAEAKYDLYSAISKDTKIYNKPWWKETLKGKYIRSLDPQSKAAYFDIKSWIFMKDGFDDFRDGLPRVFDDDAFVKGNDKEIGPNTPGGNGKPDGFSKCSGITFSKIGTRSSKKSSLEQQRLDQVTRTERELMQHPLALYPHLGDCLQADLFQDVVEILDPATKHAFDEDNAEAEIEQVESEVNREQSAAREDEGEESYPLAEEQYSPLQASEVSRLSDEIDARVFRHPFCRPPQDEEKEKKAKKKNLEKQKRGSLSEDENIRQVTAEFCSWVSSLGGDGNNIDESTVMNLFSNGYDAKPAVSVPIHAVELSNVPPELRRSIQLSSRRATSSLSSPDHQAGDAPDDNVPSWIKFRYGAWYLKPNMWKVRPAGQPLRDSKDTKYKEMSEAKKACLKLDYGLAAMHGTKLFKDFVDKKDVRKPQFLQHIEEIHADQGQDEHEAKTDHGKTKRRSSAPKRSK